MLGADTRVVVVVTAAVAVVETEMGMGSGKKEKHDLEVEKARLLSLALDFGFDHDSASKCLNRLIALYGTLFFSPSPSFSLLLLHSIPISHTILFYPPPFLHGRLYASIHFNLLSPFLNI